MSADKKDNSPLPFAEPEEVGFSSGRLASIRPVMQTYIDNRVAPNLITLVARHGKIVHFEVQGYMDIETKKPVQKDTIYRLWSNTKAITGAATMICIEEGLLTLDDPISKFLPSFKNPVVRAPDLPGERRGGGPGMTPTVPASREITVRDCLRNTTGLATASRAPIQYLTDYRNIITDPGWLPNPMARSEPLKETVEAQAKLPLSFHPGTVFEYHVGFPVIGVVLELVTGKTLDEFFKERIFEPLGMVDSSFYLPGDKLDRFPVCYRPVREGKEWKLAIADRPETSEKVAGPKTYFEAGGGLGGVLGTISDYTRFCQMLLNGGELDGVRILGRKSVEIMTSSHTAEDIYVGPAGPGFGFGIGVGVYKGSTPPILRSVGTYGWGGAAGTMFFADPREDLLCVLFTQVLMDIMNPGATYRDTFERMVYQALI
jgi:CubicO group peptidase (beta-lactamase class C family)